MTPATRLGSAVETLLQRTGCRELRRLGGSDVDRLAGRRVAPLACRSVADAELAEAGKRDLTPGGQLVGDHLDRRLYHLTCLAGGQPSALRDLLAQLVLGHATPFSSVFAASRLTAGEDDDTDRTRARGAEKP